jgi:hypothetical protein
VKLLMHHNARVCPWLQAYPDGTKCSSVQSICTSPQAYDVAKAEESVAGMSPSTAAGTCCQTVRESAMVTACDTLVKLTRGSNCLRCATHYHGDSRPL